MYQFQSHYMLISQDSAAHYLDGVFMYYKMIQPTILTIIHHPFSMALRYTLELGINGHLKLAFYLPICPRSELTVLLQSQNYHRTIIQYVFTIMK